MKVIMTLVRVLTFKLFGKYILIIAYKCVSTVNFNREKYPLNYPI